MPSDMEGIEHDTGDQPAKAAGQSEQNSVEQKSARGSGKNHASSDGVSITVPIQELQEPEAIGFRTGTDLPTVELLRDVVIGSP